MIEIQKGIAETLLNAVTGTGAGSSYALPVGASQVTWQTVFGTAPDAVSIRIETSNDGSTWAVASSSTSTTSEMKTIATSALFVRGNLVSKTNGTTFSIVLVAKDAFDLAAHDTVLTGDATLENAAISGTLAVTGVVTLTDDLSVGDDLTVIGATVNTANLPVFADEAAAAALTTGDWYRTAAGALRIKL